MKIEKEKIRMEPLNLPQIQMSAKLVGIKTQTSLPLSALQIEMLGLFRQGLSIEAVVQSFLAKRILISFLALEKLVQFLVEEEIILNESFRAYYQQEEEVTQVGFLGKLKSHFSSEEPTTPAVKEELKGIPFLRTLAPEIQSVFLDHMRIVDAPAGIAVCQQDQVQRSLFVLLKGQASVIKRGNAPKPRRIAVLSEGSIFGEVGFFLGEPRTADVVTDVKSQIVRLKYQSEVFDSLIQTETARQVQKRFWVIHALLKSEIFQSVPDDCFDALVFAGDLKNVSANTWICKEGDPGDSCYVIVQGSLVVSRGSKTIRAMGQGDCFGEMALMVTQGKRSASVRSQTDCLLLEIRFDRFYQLLSRNLKLACEFEKIALERMKADHQRT